VAAARRWALAVDRAARRGLFRPSCLTASVALQRLLERHGVAGGRLHVGVRQDGERFEAHAWVTLGGVLLRDDPAHVAGFRELPGVRFTDRG
jgi:hypothetical protein